MKEKELKEVKNEAKTTAKEVNDLQNEIANKTKELQKCLEDLNRKKELSDRRSKFIDALDRLNELADVIKESNEFETSSASFKLYTSSSPYRADENILSVSNPGILREIIKFLQDKIHKKIAELEAELMA